MAWYAHGYLPAIPTWMAALMGGGYRRDRPAMAPFEPRGLRALVPLARDSRTDRQRRHRGEAHGDRRCSRVGSPVSAATGGPGARSVTGTSTFVALHQGPSSFALTTLQRTPTRAATTSTPSCGGWSRRWTSTSAASKATGTLEPRATGRELRGLVGRRAAPVWTLLRVARAAATDFAGFETKSGLNETLPALEAAFGTRFRRGASRGLAAQIGSARANGGLILTGGGLSVANGAPDVRPTRVVRDHGFAGGAR